jgi:hypothetical protein
MIYFGYSPFASLNINRFHIKLIPRFEDLNLFIILFSNQISILSLQKQWR